MSARDPEALAAWIVSCGRYAPRRVGAPQELYALDPTAIRPADGKSAFDAPGPRP